MKKILLPVAALCLLFAACSNETGHEAPVNSPIVAGRATAKLSEADTNYIATGFYFLAEDGKGIRMRKEHSNEIYTLSPNAFASVKNVIKTKLERTKGEQGIYTEMCMTFDEHGTKDLKEGTGNIAHTKIAAVIANKLLFVVENRVSIKTGIMCVGLVGYSEEVMQDMKHAVDNKQ